MNVLRRLVLGLALLAHGVACERQPQRVFVPGAAFRHVVEVRTEPSAEIRVGEWLTLHARRSTGPWREVERSTLGPEGCWVAPAPAPEENEVADNLAWTTRPANQGEFNLGIRPDHTRQVRFSRPGRYVLKGRSSTWCSPKVESNELTVEVRP